MKYTLEINGDSDVPVVMSSLGILLTDAQAASVCARAWRYFYANLQKDLSGSGSSESDRHGSATDERK